MSCGRAVIGANTSSVPEVIGRDDALFNPRSDAAITDKLEHVLTNDDFRAGLEQHGLSQSKLFSWDASAQPAIATIEAWQAKQPPAACGFPDLPAARRWHMFHRCRPHAVASAITAPNFCPSFHVTTILT